MLRLSATVQANERNGRYNGISMSAAVQFDTLPERVETQRGLIAVAMSGGVDSSAVAALLQQQGRTVVGLTMQLWNQRRLPELQGDGPAQHRCCSLDAVYDAKAEVRALARRANLPVAEKPESMELCFVPTGNYVQFIQAYSHERGIPLQNGEGEIIDENGDVIGRHNGVHNFTIGQRKGLGFAAGKPLYVLSIDPEKNRVVVGEDDVLRNTVCEVEGVNWIYWGVPLCPIRLFAKTRQ